MQDTTFTMKRIMHAGDNSRFLVVELPPDFSGSVDATCDGNMLPLIAGSSFNLIGATW